MPLIVPHRRGVQAPTQAQQPAPALDPMYAIMAATQMHSEGRLLAQDQPAPTNVMPLPKKQP